METATVGIILGIVIMAIFLFRLTKKVLKPIIIMSIIILIMSVLFSLNIIQDAKEFSEKFPQAQKLFLLKENGAILAGFTGKLYDAGDVIFYLNSSDLAQEQKMYASNPDNSTYFRTIVLDVSALTETITILGENITARNALDIIRKPGAKDALVSTIINSQELPNTENLRRFIEKSIDQQTQVKDDDQLRALIFAQLTSKATQEPLFFLRHFKEGDAEIYPQTITFKLAQIIPLPITSWLLQWE